MPHISLTLYKGRTREAREELAMELQNTLCKAAGWKKGDISVSIREEEPENFGNYVNRKLEKEELIIPSDYIGS